MTSLISSVGRGLCYASSAVYTGVSKAAGLGTAVVNGAVKTVAFITVPRSTAIAAISTIGGLYARNVAYTNAPQVISKVTISYVSKQIGNQTVGKLVAEAIILPALVPYATPIVAKTAGVAAGMVLIGAGNAIHARMTAPKQEKQAAASKPALSTATVDEIIADFDIVGTEAA